MGDSLIHIIKNGCDQRIIKNDKINELSEQFRSAKISSKSEWKLSKLKITYRLALFFNFLNMKRNLINIIKKSRKN